HESGKIVHLCSIKPSRCWSSFTFSRSSPSCPWTPISFPLSHLVCAKLPSGLGQPKIIHKSSVHPLSFPWRERDVPKGIPSKKPNAHQPESAKRKGVNKLEAVRQALTALGTDAKPTQ